MRLTHCRTLTVLSSLLLSLVAVAPSAAVLADDEILDNKFLPAPRELLQRLSRGRVAAQQKEFNVAVEELGGILSPDADQDDPSGMQDYFIITTSASGAMPSLKTEAQRLIGAMPQQGRDLYELRYGAAAKGLLQEAIQSDDVNKLSDITRRYFHTKAGYEAMMLLGRHHLDRGRPLAAAMCFQRLINSPGRNAFDPEASLLLAACWLYADYPQRATEVLVQMGTRQPGASIRVGGTNVPIFRDEGQALPWLEQILGKLHPMMAQQRAQWVLYRGDASRNGKSNGGVPVANFRWRSQISYDPVDEELIQEKVKEITSSGGVLIPTTQPLVVNDVVLVRTPRKLLAIDFRTGKIVWPYPWDKVPDQLADRSQDTPPQRNTPSPREEELKERLWKDSAYGQVSSDGSSVYLLDGLGYANELPPPVVIGPGGFPQQNGGWPKSHNKLVSLSLAREGSLQWIVGGDDGGDEPKLAGAFFLGPPLPVMGQLFVLAEMAGELRLIVMDPKNGSLQWYQQLAHVDTLTIMEDSLRRLSGATPSFADGVLVCPTSAGAVVAVDVASRSLLWGYQYSTNGYFPHNPRIGGFNRNVLQQAQPATELFADATVTIANGRVILTPAETDQMFCLELMTGAQLWSPRSRAEILYVACVHKDKAIMVGSTSVTAIDLEDGTSGWSQDIPLVSEAPTGRGFYTDNYYYLPTAASQLLKIDLDQGRVEQRINTRMPLGNLVCYKDQVISQGVDWVSAFYQIEPLRRWVDQKLKENPADRVALARQCDLLLQEGKRKEALDVMWSTYRSDPTDESIKDLLVQTLLEALAEDFDTYGSQAPELEPLIVEPEQRIAYLRLMSVGLEKSGDLESAFNAIVQLVDAPQPATSSTNAGAMEKVDRRWSVLRDRWIRGRFASLLAAANKPEHAALREQWDKDITQRQQNALASKSRPEIRRFLEQFGAHPAADAVRLAYAQILISAGENLAAELHLSQLMAAPEKPEAAPATALLAQLLLNAQRPDEAAVYYRRVQQTWPDQIVLDGKTGNQLFADAQQSPLIAEQLAGSLDWPYGRVTVEAQDLENNSQNFGDADYPVQLLDTRGAWPEGAVVNIEAQNTHLPVAIAVRDAHGREMQRTTLTPTRGYGVRYDLTSVKTNGHLVLAAVQSDVIAIDSLRPADDAMDSILWKAERNESAIGINNVNLKTLRHVWNYSGVRSVAADASPARIPIGAMGPVTADGVCFQKARQLMCVDPISGEVIWTRDNVEPGADLFGDDQYLFVVPFDQKQATVLNSSTGELIGMRDIEKLENRWATLGRNVLVWSEQGDRYPTRLYDVLTGQVWWQRDFAAGSRGQLIGADELAIVQPSGELTIVSLRDGKELCSAQLDPQPGLAHLFVERTPDSYLVTTGLPATKLQRFSVFTPASCTPLIEGSVYALKRSDGSRLWQSRGIVEQFSMPLVQYGKLPILVLVRGTTLASQQNRAFGSIVCVDKRDGRVLMAVDDVPLPATAVTLSVESDPQRKRVALHLGTRTFVLTFTDEPLPPAAPVQTGDASSLPNPLTNNRVKQWAGAIVDAFREGG